MNNLKIGDTAPDFTLESTDGEKVSLKDYRGKIVVLYFYPKDNTSGCTKEACGFRDLKGEFEALDAVILGVSPDSRKSHRNFSDKFQLNFTLLADTEKEVSEIYGVYQKKKRYGKEYMGIVRTTFIINPEGIIAQVFPEVKVAGHIDEVLESVKRMQR